MVYSFERPVYLKRLPTIIDRTWNIQYYDADNLYPQRADEVRKRSYTTKSAVESTAYFISGEGWIDTILANLILNQEGMTGNDVLDFIAQDKAPFTGFALHFTYNLNYRISQVTPIDFMFCRLGLPDQFGNVCDIKYSNNWEMDYNKVVDKVFDVKEYPVFNPDPNVVKAQIQEYGFENYPGQILYWTPKSGVYPLASFDPVFDNAQTQSEIGVYELSAVQNDFGIEKIFKYPGTFEDDDKRREFKRKLDAHKGAKGAKSTLVVENPSGEDLNLIESIQMQNTDKMFEFTSKNVKNAIRESMSVPAPILGQLPENGMFNQDQVKDSYIYFNSRTRIHRSQISRVFQKIMAYWKDPVTISSFAIKELVYGATANDQTGATTSTTDFNANLAGLTGKQSQNLRRIQRQFDKGTITRSQAIAELKLSFGLTDAQAATLIDDDPSNDAV
jgi:hypothetical protein